MKTYVKPTLTRLTWQEGQPRYQAYAYRNSQLYRDCLAPGEVWEDDPE